MSAAEPPARNPRRRGLGRGLDALLASMPTGDANDEERVLVEVDPNSVAPNPEQPRRDFDEDSLQMLADSIRTHGLLHPVVVERRASGYTLVAGERRLRAARLAGVAAIPAIVRPSTESARESLELALTENLTRADLNPIEEAAAYARLADTFGMSHDAIAMRVGRARPTISNAIRLLGLTPPVQEQVATGRLAVGAARALLSLADPEEQKALARQIEEDQIPAQVVERMVQQRVSSSSAANLLRQAGRAAVPRLSADDEAVRRGLEQAVGLPVLVRRRRRGGEVIVAFASEDDLAGLYTRLGGPPL